MRPAGAKRARVKFQRRAATGGDGYGNPEGEFADLGIERSAELRPTRGGEEVQAARMTGTAMWDLWVRSDSGTRTISPGDRVVDVRNPQRIWNIRFVGDMDGRNHDLLMQLESGVAT